MLYPGISNTPKQHRGCALNLLYTCLLFVDGKFHMVGTNLCIWVHLSNFSFSFHIFSEDHLLLHLPYFRALISVFQYIDVLNNRGMCIYFPL